MNVRHLYAATSLVAAISATATHEVYAAQKVASPVFTTIYRFDGGKKGSLPQAGVTADPAGTGVLYGVTTGGGASAAGVVFKLKPAAGKKAWPITILHDFKGNGSNADGRNPVAELLVSPSTGAIYGTTANGGSSDKGTVFQLLPPRSGETVWRQSILANFDKYQVRGANPHSALIFDGGDGLIGSALLGGGQNDGTAFRMKAPSGKHGWGFTVLHTFGAVADDGVQPGAGLVRDPSTGLLYGTTLTGGKHNGGTVYSLTQGSGKITILYNFTGGNDGGAPNGNIIIGADGSLYSTASIGGAFNNGVVFQLKPANGKWKYRVLHQFRGGNDGAQPKGLSVGTGGALYGATLYGGGSNICNGGCGTVFKMTPPASGGQIWQETILHHFGGRSDSSGPQGTLAVDTNDNDTLYGTTTGGNSENDYGTVFRLRH